MTTDWRALCAELVKELDDLRESSEGVAGFHRNGDLAPWSELGESGEFPWLSSFDRARAALAKTADAPAAVAERPSDEELRDLWSWAAGQDQGPWPTQYHCFARAVLSRWAHPAAAPVPDFGEVAAALKVIDKMQQEWVLLGNDDDGTASPSLSMPISLRRFTVLRDALFRAATLLQQQAAPVPVSERLPGPEDCDAEGRCWVHQPVDYSPEVPTWQLLFHKYASANYGTTAWLPAHALPLPAPEGGEVS